MFLWIKFRLAILGQASSSPICYRWLLSFITGTPLVMSLSLLSCLASFLPLSLRPEWGHPGPPPGAQPWIGDTLVYQSSTVRAILTLCIIPPSDKRLLSWHAHKIDRSFKDHTSGFSPLLWIAYTWHAHYFPLHALSFRFRFPISQAATGFSLCQYVVEWKLTRRDFLMISDLFVFFCQNTLCISRTRPWWCILRHPRHSRFGCQKLCILEACLHVWKSKPNKHPTDMDKDSVDGNISWHIL